MPDARMPAYAPIQRRMLLLTHVLTAYFHQAPSHHVPPGHDEEPTSNMPDESMSAYASIQRRMPSLLGPGGTAGNSPPPDASAYTACRLSGHGIANVLQAPAHRQAQRVLVPMGERAWVITACTPERKAGIRATHPNICTLDVHQKRLRHELRPRKGTAPAAVWHVVELPLIHRQGVQERAHKVVVEGVSARRALRGHCMHAALLSEDAAAHELHSSTSRANPPLMLWQCSTCEHMMSR